jgi:hypothetical protein
MRGTYEQEPGADEQNASPAKVAVEDEEGADDPSVAATRQEMSGLMDRVRTLARQFKSP